MSFGVLVGVDQYPFSVLEKRKNSTVGGIIGKLIVNFLRPVCYAEITICDSF
jgi:hypothetical protein